MIERAVENWLTKTNERNYQVAFCQALVHEGHKILQVSPHGAMEQGKDIITVDRTDEYCAYQLKTGNINLTKWREIWGEITDLVELPIIHPSVDRTRLHKSFLVTNGGLTTEVIHRIDLINDNNRRRGYSHLDVIDGQTLLRMFIDAQKKLIPKVLENFNSFLEFFILDGTDFLPKGKFFSFFENILFKNIPRRKSDTINSISGSVIVAAHLLGTYQIKNNYYAQFEAWTSLAACIARYAQKTGLKKREWIDSYNLVISEIVRNLSELKKETLEKVDFLEGDWLGDGGLIYWARVTIVLGSLAALENYFRAIDNSYTKDEQIADLIRNNTKFLWFWGESAFPYFFNLIKYWEFNGEYQTAQCWLDRLLIHIVEWNSPIKKKNRKDSDFIVENMGLANPYYGVDTILEVALGIDLEKVDFAQFLGNSYTLESMILMLARRNKRGILKRNWRKLSHILFREFRPDKIEDVFTWSVHEGSNHREFPEETQSWTELVREAKDLSRIPCLYREHLDLLGFFILVFPHRANKQIISFLDLSR
jgi:hypothetical protein